MFWHCVLCREKSWRTAVTLGRLGPTAEDDTTHADHHFQNPRHDTAQNDFAALTNPRPSDRVCRQRNEVERTNVCSTNSTGRLQGTSDTEHHTMRRKSANHAGTPRRPHHTSGHYAERSRHLLLHQESLQRQYEIPPHGGAQFELSLEKPMRA